MAGSDFHSPQANRHGNLDPSHDSSPVRTEQEDKAKDEVNSGAWEHLGGDADYADGGGMYSRPR